jgi:hypothetical protein
MSGRSTLPSTMRFDVSSRTVECGQKQDVNKAWRGQHGKYTELLHLSVPAMLKAIHFFIEGLA